MNKPSKLESRTFLSFLVLIGVITFTRAAAGGPLVSGLKLAAVTSSQDTEKRREERIIEGAKKRVRSFFGIPAVRRKNGNPYSINFASDIRFLLLNTGERMINRSIRRLPWRPKQAFSMLTLPQRKSISLQA